MARADRKATPQAFTDVYAAHHRRLVRLAYLLSGDADQAEDVVADVFASVLRRWGHTQIDDPGAYLRRSVVNRVNSGFRRRYLARRVASRADGSDRGVLLAAEGIAERDAMFQALDRLPDAMRTTVVLRFYEELSVAEVARALGVSEGTVKSQTSRALTRLGTILEDVR